MADREDQKKQLIVDYKQTFLTPQGQRVLEDLERKTTLHRSSVKPGQPIDTNRLIYDEAQRSMILYILQKMGKDPYEVKQSKAIQKENEDGKL
jgi:hypothetical protein